MVADRGLCGAYNTSVLRATERLLAQGRADGVEYRLFTAGKKAQGYFRFRHQPVERSFIGMSERPTFADARRVAAAVLTPFVDEEVDQVAGGLHPLLLGRQPEGRGAPTAAAASTPAGATWPTPTRPSRRPGRCGYTEFEPDAADPPRRAWLPGRAETEIFAALLEASAAEVTARQRAMAAATENAGELITKYSPDHEPGPPGHHHHRDHGDRGRGRGPAGRLGDDEGGLIIETTV